MHAVSRLNLSREADKKNLLINKFYLRGPGACRIGTKRGKKTGGPNGPPV